MVEMKEQVMGAKSELDAFLTPGSVAVVGATERPGAWGSFIMRGLLSLSYPGEIYPVNRQADQVSGVHAYKDIRQIKAPIDLAVLAIPEEFVEEAIMACGQKKVRGITIITAGFAETSRVGRERQERLAGLARSYGIRLLGPNVSGTFNLHVGFNASPAPANNLLPTPIAATTGWVVWRIQEQHFAERGDCGFQIFRGWHETVFKMGLNIDNPCPHPFNMVSIRWKTGFRYDDFVTGIQRRSQK